MVTDKKTLEELVGEKLNFFERKGYLLATKENNSDLDKKDEKKYEILPVYDEKDKAIEIDEKRVVAYRKEVIGDNRLKNPYLNASCVLVYDDKGILFLRRKKHKETEKRKWEIPGEFVKPGENYIDGAKRCCEEEKGVMVQLGELEEFWKGKIESEKLNEFCTAYFIEDDGRFGNRCLSEEHDKEKWISFKKLEESKKWSKDFNIRKDQEPIIRYFLDSYRDR